MGDRCYVDADCWHDCNNDEGPCYAYRDSAGICHSGCGGEKIDAGIEINDDQKIPFVVSSVSGDFLASLLQNILSEETVSSLRKSSKNFSFALASASKAELVDAIESML